MNIRPSAAIRQNYNEIADLCRETAEPIFLTKNGEGDLEQQNKYRVIVSARAAQMLVSHAAFLAQVNPAAAERLTVEFEKAAKSLEQMPQRCPWLKGEYIPKNAYRFILFEKRYMLIFQIVDHTVYADHVVDCRQDYGWLIR